MPRIKKKKETAARPEKKSSDTILMLIFFLLLVQTVFLFYKNSDVIKDMFREDPNSIYNESKSLEEGLNGSGRFENIDPKNIRISVLNGCGIPGLAAKWKDKLRDMNFDVRETGNSRIQYDKTIILSRSEDLSYANYLAQTVGIPNENILMQLNKDLVDIDLTVIVGSDYKKFDK
ncbi:MAG: LytR C-terminal domain-containing protein [Candidatus Delongbacteria bacterium]|nr:LytR C-terminal domain-containing protein [Candidatus Delongbacteria bacterium]